MICDLCRREFNETEGRSSCSGCGEGKTCGGVRCPHCYYEIIPKPLWLEKLTRFFRRPAKQKSNDGENVPLTSFEVHTRAEITEIETGDRAKLRKILAMGALPGTEIMLVQKFPSFVFQIGESRFSVDHQLASAIRCRGKACLAPTNSYQNLVPIPSKTV